MDEGDFIMEYEKINNQYSERIEQIIDTAKKNDNKIGYYTVSDILKDKESQITEEEIEQIVGKIQEFGIEVELYDAGEEYQSSHNTDPGKFIPADVNITPRNFSIETIVDRLEHNEIDLKPAFQRAGGLWSAEKQSQLIESLMLRIPLPTFYFDAASEDKWVVIDGLQRLTALRNFMIEKDEKKRLHLIGLEYLKEFEGYTYSELPRQYFRRIRETQIMVYTVEKGTPEEVVFNIFKRINTGGLVLEPQEIRHALYQGKATELIGRLAKMPEFLKVTENKISTVRMADCEYVTRFVAFTELDYRTEYKGNIDNYLILAMKKLNNLSEDELARIADNFKHIMKACYEIMDKYAFRRYGNLNKRGPINKAIFELWCICLNNRNEEEISYLISKKDIVKRKFGELLANTDFSVWIKAGDRYSMENRIQATEKMLQEVIDDNKNKAV